MIRYLGQDRRLIPFGNGYQERLRIRKCRRAVISNANRDRIRVRPLQLVGRPRKQSTGRVDLGTTREPGVEAIAQRIRRNIRIGRACGKRKQSPLGHRLIGELGEHRRSVPLGDGYQERLRIRKRRSPIISNANRYRIRIRALRFIRRPGKQSTRGVDVGTTGEPRVEAVTQRIRRNIWINRISRKRNRIPLGHRLIRYLSQYRRLIPFRNGYQERLGIRQRRSPVISNANRYRIRIRPLQLVGRPGKESAGGVDLGPAGESRVEAIAQRVGRNVRIGRSSGKRKQIAIGHRLIRYLGQNRGLVLFSDGYNKRLGIGQRRRAIISSANRDRMRIRAVRLAGRPGKQPATGVDLRPAGKASIQAVTQRIRRNIRIGRTGSERKRIALGHCLIGKLG